MDNSQKKWYKRVMKWTQNNRQAYITIKVIQTIFTTAVLEWTIVKFKAWNADRPNDPYMPAVKVALSMLCFDLLCYILDFVMVIKRWKFCTQFRYIVCCISFSLAIAIQTILYIDQSKSDKSFIEQFGTGGGPFRLLLLIVFYIYETYVIWMTINILMYFQILNMENQDIKAKAKRLKQASLMKEL